MFKNIVAVSLMGFASLIQAAGPKQLITHNHTNVESNAYINGTIASRHPTKANSDNKVFWASVKLACYGHITNNQCQALIKMASDTPNPIDLGWVTVDLVTGDITPKYVAANGYHMIVNGPGETSLYND